MNNNKNKITFKKILVNQKFGYNNVNGQPWTKMQQNIINNEATKLISIPFEKKYRYTLFPCVRLII